MNKFFKRILPATILATCCTVSVFSMTACNEGKDYSEDIAKLQQQIEDLQTENNTLKDKVNNLTPGGVDYTEEIEALQQQIETLKSQNASYLEESTKLKQQIETLKTNNESNLSEISKLETQLANLKTSNDSNLSEIEKLQQQIAILQQGNSNELKTYKIGDTFTYSYMGVDYFSLTLKDRSTLIIKNLNMIDFIPKQIIAFRISTTEGYAKTTMPSSKIQIGKEFTIQNTALADEALEYVFGYPIGENGILPYAVFDLTS